MRDDELLYWNFKCVMRLYLRFFALALLLGAFTGAVVAFQGDWWAPLLTLGIIVPAALVVRSINDAVGDQHDLIRTHLILLKYEREEAR